MDKSWSQLKVSIFFFIPFFNEGKDSKSSQDKKQPARTQSHFVQADVITTKVEGRIVIYIDLFWSHMSLSS